jgi:hypothetical protein
MSKFAIGEKVDNAADDHGGYSVYSTLARDKGESRTTHTHDFPIYVSRGCRRSGCLALGPL